MYIRKYKIRGTMWWLLEALNAFCFAITILAIIGSVQVIVKSASSYTPFENA